MMATGHEIAMGLRAAYLSMQRQTNSLLAPHGITADQFVLLSLLNEQDGVTQQQLTRRASSDPNTIRAMLVLMENIGMIERARHPTDGRALKITLTQRGRRTYKKLSDEIRVLQEALISGVQPTQAETLVTLLNRISEAMSKWESNRQVKKII